MNSTTPALGRGSETWGVRAHEACVTGLDGEVNAQSMDRSPPPRAGTGGGPKWSEMKSSTRGGPLLMSHLPVPRNKKHQLMARIEFCLGSEHDLPRLTATIHASG